MILAVIVCAFSARYALGESARNGVHGNHSPDTHNGYYPSAQSRDGAFPQNQTEKPKEHKKPCDSPANRDEDDTCSQARSAKAAEDAVEMSKQQIELGWYGLYAGVIAAVATAVAAIAAAAAAVASEKAVKAAETANKLNREFFRQENRAWLVVQGVKVSDLVWEERGARFQLDFEIKNVGKTIAHNVWFEAVAFANGKKSVETGETLEKYCVRRAESRNEIFKNGSIIAPGMSEPMSFGLVVFRDDIADNIFIDPDWFSIKIKTCAAYRCEMFEGTRYFGRSFDCIDVSDRAPRLLRISNGDLKGGRFGFCANPCDDIAT